MTFGIVQYVLGLIFSIFFLIYCIHKMHMKQIDDHIKNLTDELRKYRKGAE